MSKGRNRSCLAAVILGAIPCVVLIIVGALVVAPNLDGDQGPSRPTAEPTYTGRLLAIDNEPQGSWLTVLQLTPGSHTPTETATQVLTHRAYWVSPDVTRFVTEDGSLTAIGTDTVEHLSAPGRIEWVVFSPDGMRLAYGAGSGLYVYDLAAKTDRLILPIPCASYSGNIVCGWSQAVWLDQATLFASIFDGMFPSSIPCNLPPNCADAYLGGTGASSIVTVTGKVVATPIGMDFRPRAVFGNTIVLADNTWIDLNVLVAGGHLVATPLPTGTLFVSPDGSKAVVGDPAHADVALQVVDIRTGTMQELGTHGYRLQSAVWSPDGQFLAGQGWGESDSDIVIVPMSTAGGWVVGRIPGRAYLVAWLP